MKKILLPLTEKSFQEFIDKCKRGITAEYIDTLEELCIEKTRICDIYVEIIGKQDKELMLQREKIAQISEIQATMKRQNVRLRDCKKIVSQYEKSFNVSWIERLWRQFETIDKIASDLFLRIQIIEVSFVLYY